MVIMGWRHCSHVWHVSVLVISVMGVQISIVLVVLVGIFFTKHSAMMFVLTPWWVMMVSAYHHVPFQHILSPIQANVMIAPQIVGHALKLEPVQSASPTPTTILTTNYAIAYVQTLTTTIMIICYVCYVMDNA